VFDFYLAEVVFPKKETTAGGCGDSHNIAFPLRHQTGQRWIIAEDVIHLSLQTAGETLPSTAKCRALGADMMKNPVGEGEEDVGGTVG
jgi:hypothetical protein